MIRWLEYERFTDETFFLTGYQVSSNLFDAGPNKSLDLFQLRRLI